MGTQKEQIILNKEEFRELIKGLEPGTMLTLEMPEPEETNLERNDSEERASGTRVI